MREIKFRAWDNDRDVMFDALNHDIFDFNEIVEKERFDVMQYTGLKDENGIEFIREGE